MTDLLILLIYPALQYERGGWYRLWAPVTIIAWVLDFIIAHTVWRLVAGPLQGKERTISDSLERLCRDSANPDVSLFIELARKINRISPTHDHIKAVL